MARPPPRRYGAAGGILPGTHSARVMRWSDACCINSSPTGMISSVRHVVLVFIPGPAVVFFALTAALLGAQSRWVARQLDAAETGGRKWLRKLRAKRAKRA
jgi:hypothetical protein